MFVIGICIHQVEYSVSNVVTMFCPMRCDLKKKKKHNLFIYLFLNEQTIKKLV